MAVIIGTSGNDRLTGTNLVDSISGLSGNDRLYGLDDIDSLSGGEGLDRLYGGSGGAGAPNTRGSGSGAGQEAVSGRAFTPSRVAWNLSRLGKRDRATARLQRSEDEARAAFERFKS